MGSLYGLCSVEARRMKNMMLNNVYKVAEPRGLYGGSTYHLLDPFGGLGG